MQGPSTCGQGLAENSALPAKLGDLTAALSAILEAHMKALDRSDDRAREEHAVYRELATTFRGVASQLYATAGQMAAARALPMAPHDEKAMTAPDQMDAFRGFVRVEEELRALLEQRIVADRGLLGEPDRA
jgi:hypothetical protein